MKHANKVKRLIAKQEAWKRLSREEKEGTRMPGSVKKT